MHKTSLFFAIAFTSALVTACHEPPSMNEPFEDEAGSTGGELAVDDSSEDGEMPSEETGTEAACDLETHACISNVPEGWNGPVALTDDECGGAFEWTAVEAFDALVVDPMECGCTCGSPSGGGCGAQTRVEFYPPHDANDLTQNDGVCDTLEDEATALAFEAVPLPDAPWRRDDTYLIAHPVEVAIPGSCAPTPFVNIPAFELEGVVRACEPTDPISACDDGSLCVPRPPQIFENHMCIWAMGEQACPAGSDFVHREIHKTGINDTRTCTECSCDAAVGEACSDAYVSLERSNDAGSAIVDADGRCSFAANGNEVWSTITLDPGTPQGGACEPQGGVPQGGVAAQDMITFCCT